MIITGQDVTLCPIDRRHRELTLSWANNLELARLLDRSKPISDIEHEQWFAKLHEREDCVYFAIEMMPSRKHVGNVWLWAIDFRHRKAELRIVIGEGDSRGKGFGSEAIGLLCLHAFRSLNLHKVYAYVLATNPGGRRAFEKAGFEIEGTLKQDRWVEDHFTDVYLFGKLSPSS